MTALFGRWLTPAPVNHTVWLAMAVTAPDIPELIRRSIPSGDASVSWDSILGPVQKFLTQVTEMLEGQVDLFEPEIAEHARYALDNRGKQLRPALVGLSAGAVGRIRPEHVTIAVLVEMVHLATLVHDDIMDGAYVRRGRPTVGSRWGNHLAVLLGDCLFAHAMKVAATLPVDDVFRSLALATNSVCTGEILQSNRRRRWDLSRADYLRMVELKTAELFAVAAELGGRHAGASPAEESALRHFALAAGTAYQVYDDCVDLFGSERVVGKSLGTDLATGKLTLPVIVLLERASPTDSAEVVGWLNQWSPDYLVGLHGLLESHDAMSECAHLIGNLLQKARTALEPLPQTGERKALESFTRFIASQTALLAR
ncbi:MAG TPA: polyprenyl synthetase family protein [Verrucomicrobiota bacterium]|nr:polyprenyl synthetase family protein [Verrucomicrobiota bacterium]